MEPNSTVWQHKVLKKESAHAYSFHTIAESAKRLSGVAVHAHVLQHGALI